MYLTIKPFLVLLCMAGAFSYFFYKTKALIDLMRAAPGGVIIDRIPERTFMFLREVIWQSSVRRNKPIVGIAHTLIFWGFLVITVGTLEMMVEGIFHGLTISSLSPTVHGWYVFISDFAAIGVLGGVAFGFYRRLVIKPDYLTNGLDAKLILVFTATLMISLYGYNMFRIPLEPDAFINSYFILSTPLAAMFGLNGASSSLAFAGTEFFYWVHLSMVLGFLVYIPNSKHLHVLSAAPNIFFKRLGPEKAFEKTDFEDESLEQYGIANSTQLPWGMVLDLYACTECGRCEEQCPAAMTGKPLSPKKIIHDLKVDLLSHSKTIREKGDLGAIPGFVQNEGEISPDVIWSCTTCRACEVSCPVGIEQISPIIESRRNLVQMEAAFPAELQTVFKNLENNFTPWAFPADSRADWCQELGVKQMSEHRGAEVLYYVGCAGSFDDRAKKVATAIVKLLKMASIDFAILGKEEKCNGDPARRAGNEYLAQMLIQENVETLNKYQPKTILAACPHCFNTLRNEYPAFGAQYHVVHHSQFLRELVDSGQIPLNNKSDERITYHDSCYLGRWNGEYDAPRALLKSAGVKLDEVERRRTKGLCCGAGGARMFMEETIGKRVNIERTEELTAKKTKTVAANCPFCTTMITDGLKDANQQDDVVVKDIAEILLEATGKG